MTSKNGKQLGDGREGYNREVISTQCGKHRTFIAQSYLPAHRLYDEQKGGNLQEQAGNSFVLKGSFDCLFSLAIYIYIVTKKKSAVIEARFVFHGEFKKLESGVPVNKSLYHDQKLCLRPVPICLRSSRAIPSPSMALPASI